MVAKARRAVRLSREDERLRRESPAYRPDADWEVMDPQSMEIVLSVRFDPRTARQLSRVASETRRTLSGVLRDWTLERLATPEATDLSRPAASVRESAASYVATDDYEALREAYRPAGKLSILMVGESRPAGGTFFYLANSNLYYATHEAFAKAFGPIPSGEAFLRFLAAHGVWLYDLAGAPVNRLAGRPRNAAVSARIDVLVDLVRRADPAAVVAVKRDLAPLVRRAMAAAQVPLERLHVLPFPLYQWRREFVKGLAAVARRLFDDASPGGDDGAPLDDPHELVRSFGQLQTQRVTEADIRGGRIRIPARTKPALPREPTQLRVDLRGEIRTLHYDPRNGPYRARSGVIRTGREMLASLVRPDEALDLHIASDGTVVLK